MNVITDRFKTIGTGKYNFKSFHTPPTDQFLEKKKKGEILSWSLVGVKGLMF